MYQLQLRCGESKLGQRHSDPYHFGDFGGGCFCNSTVQDEEESSSVVRRISLRRLDLSNSVGGIDISTGRGVQYKDFRYGPRGQGTVPTESHGR